MESKIPKSVFQGLNKFKAPDYWKILGGSDSILCAFRGSIAHGTHIPHDDPNTIDDIDLMSVIVPGPEYYLGLKEWGSRGTKEIVLTPEEHNVPAIFDSVHYELTKFLSMTANGNPNVLPILWMEDEFYIHKDTSGQLLLENRNLFLTKKAWTSWRGYAQSQIHKMHKGEIAGHLGAKRREMFKEIGYDCKSASHLIRLLRTSLEFLRTCELNVWREDANQLMDIKTGKWVESDILEEADRLIKECEKTLLKSKLPDTPDYDAINKLAIRISMKKLGIIFSCSYDNEIWNVG